MSAFQIGALLIYSLGIGVGQILFKVASRSVGSSGPWRLLMDPAFIVAIALYFTLSLYWSWLLRFTPLSRAYPFLALAFVIVPITGVLYFSEPLTWRLIVGVAFIAIGALVIAT